MGTSSEPMAETSQLATFRPDLLILAREARGLTQQQLAAESGVTQGLVSKIEGGQRIPSDEVIDSLSNSLHVPREFFHAKDQIRSFGIGDAFHRRRQSVPAKQLAKIHAQMNIRRMQVERLIRSVDLGKRGLPTPSDEIIRETPEVLAQALRSSWLVPRGPVANVSALLEDAGILLIPCDFETNLIDAIGHWVPKLPPIVYVNRTAPQDRMRFTLMHEVGHLVMHGGMDLSELTPLIEPEADRFAAEFLMPASEIRPQLRNLSLPRLAQLKRYWRVSMAALLKRAGDLDMISERQKARLWTEMGKNGYRRREPVELDVHGERPGALLEEVVQLHWQELAYTPEEFADLLMMKSDETLAVYGSANVRPAIRLLPQK